MLQQQEGSIIDSKRKNHLNVSLSPQKPAGTSKVGYSDVGASSDEEGVVWGSDPLFLGASIQQQLEQLEERSKALKSQSYATQKQWVLDLDLLCTRVEKHLQAWRERVETAVLSKQQDWDGRIKRIKKGYVVCAIAGIASLIASGIGVPIGVDVMMGGVVISSGFLVFGHEHAEEKKNTCNVTGVCLSLRNNKSEKTVGGLVLSAEIQKNWRGWAEIEYRLRNLLECGPNQNKTWKEQLQEMPKEDWQERLWELKTEFALWPEHYKQWLKKMLMITPDQRCESVLCEAVQQLKQECLDSASK